MSTTAVGVPTVTFLVGVVSVYTSAGADQVRPLSLQTDKIAVRKMRWA